MLKFLKRKSADDQPQDVIDIQLATARLMFAVVKSDGRISKAELITMAEALRRQFKLSELELNDLILSANYQRLGNDEIEHITTSIRANWGNAKRMQLLQNLWAIALADDELDIDETDLVRKLAGLLYLNEMQIYQSQENAMEQVGYSPF